MKLYKGVACTMQLIWLWPQHGTKEKTRQAYSFRVFLFLMPTHVHPAPKNYLHEINSTVYAVNLQYSIILVLLLSGMSGWGVAIDK